MATGKKHRIFKLICLCVFEEQAEMLFIFIFLNVLLGVFGIVQAFGST